MKLNTFFPIGTLFTSALLSCEGIHNSQGKNLRNEAPRRFLQETTDMTTQITNDPSVWIHPIDPSKSVVIGTMKDGSIKVFDLTGSTLQDISPSSGGAYNQVDVMYAIELNDQSLIDVAVANDYVADTISFYMIDTETGTLTDISSSSSVSPIFGDEEGPSYGLTTYVDFEDYKPYIFVSQSGGNKIAQMSILEDPENPSMLKADIVKTMELPIFDEDNLALSQAEGLVVNIFSGELYVAIEDEGVYKYSIRNVTEPELLGVIADTTLPYLQPKIKGLTIYYDGFDDKGYLMVSSEGSSSFAVFDIYHGQRYRGSFESEFGPADVLNINLGAEFACGVFISQDIPGSSTFKLTKWDDLSPQIGTMIGVDTSYSPRRISLMLRAESLMKYIASTSSIEAQSELSSLLDGAIDDLRTGYRNIFSVVNSNGCSANAKMYEFGKSKDYMQRVADASAGDDYVYNLATSIAAAIPQEYD